MINQVDRANVSNLDRYYQVIIQERIYSTIPRLKFHLNNLFENIDFKDKSFLDIGGGNGRYCFYALYKGAKEAMCIEPEEDGSRSGVIHTFKKLRRLLDVENAQIESLTIGFLEKLTRKTQPFQATM